MGNDLIETSETKKISQAHSENFYPVFIFNNSVQAERTANEKALIEKMDEIDKIYRQEKDRNTLDFEITESAFDNLKGRPGVNGKGFSKLKHIVDAGKVTYHLIVAPYTTVSEINHSNNPEREELIASAMGLTIENDSQIGFELSVITSNDVPLEKRSKLYLKDILKIEVMPIETAKMLIATNS